MTFRVALVGAGAMGSIMARDIYPTVADVEVVAVVDRDPDRARTLAGPLGARAYSSLAEAAAQERIDGADIRVPHAGHADTAIDALERGLHVLVEKPLALTLADCQRVATAARTTGLVAAVAENYPHLQAVRAACAALETGEVGEPLAVRTTRAYTLDGVWARAAWRLDDPAMGGLLWDQGTHHISLLRALGGEIDSVAARRAAPPSTPGAEVYHLDLTLASGLPAQSQYCWGTPARAVEVEATVLGSAGIIDIAVDYETRQGSARLVRGAEVVSLSDGECYYDSHATIVQDWLTAIRDGRPPRVGLDSATADVAVVLAAQSSLATGTRATVAGDDSAVSP